MPGTKPIGHPASSLFIGFSGISAFLSHYNFMSLTQLLTQLLKQIRYFLHFLRLCVR